MPKMMKALVFYEPEEMRLEQVPLPSPLEDEVLVKVKACGICGSDIAYYWGLSLLETPTGKGPLIIGHEFSGEVAEVGRIPQEKGLFKAGDRVTVDPVQYCSACGVCARGMVNLCENKSVIGVSTNGAFAEYVKSKYTGIHKLPSRVSFEQAAFTEPLSCATYGINNLNISLGDSCVIFGPGPIGLMMTQMAKSRGAGTVVLVGTRDYRLKLGKKLGADFILNIKEKNSPYYIDDLKEKIKELTEGRMADRVICATGALKPMQDALTISGRKAVVVYFGLPGPNDVLKVPVLDSLLWDKTIRFSWLAPFTWATALQAIDTKLVDVSSLITHRFSLDNVLAGLKTIRDRKDNAIKGLVFP